MYVNLLVALVYRRVPGGLNSPGVVHLDYYRFGSIKTKDVGNESGKPDGSLVARQDATYSASQEEVARIVCFLDLQLTAPPAMVKTYPLIDLRDSRQPAQSESEYPCTSNPRAPSNRMP